MLPVQYVKIVPAWHTAGFMTRRRLGVKGSVANEGTPNRSFRILRWLVAGLAFLALFLVSLRAVGLV